MGILAQTLSGAIGGFSSGVGEGIKEEMKTAAQEKLENARAMREEHLANLRENRFDVRESKRLDYQKEQDSLKMMSDLYTPTGVPVTVSDYSHMTPEEKGKLVGKSGIPMSEREQAMYDKQMTLLDKQMAQSNRADSRADRAESRADLAYRQELDAKKALADHIAIYQSAVSSGDTKLIEQSKRMLEQDYIMLGRSAPKFADDDAEKPMSEKDKAQSYAKYFADAKSKMLQDDMILSRAEYDAKVYGGGGILGAAKGSAGPVTKKWTVITGGK